MSTCLLVIADGRYDVHERSWQSARENLPPFDYQVDVDDRAHELGFAGAIRQGWEQVLETGADWVFHLELDFIFRERVPTGAMIAILEGNPDIAQVALKRQPVNAEECAAGGIVDCHPDDFEERKWSAWTVTTHRRFWTTNPSLYSTRYCRMGWPQEPESEGKFTHKLLADPLLRFAFWGRKYAPPMVEHIGERVGVGY